MAVSVNVKDSEDSDSSSFKIVTVRGYLVWLASMVKVCDIDAKSAPDVAVPAVEVTPARNSETL